AGRAGTLGSGGGEVVRRGDGGGDGPQPAVGLVARLVGERGGAREVGAREAAGQVAAVGAADGAHREPVEARDAAVEAAGPRQVVGRDGDTAAAHRGGGEDRKSGG